MPNVPSAVQVLQVMVVNHAIVESIVAAATVMPRNASNVRLDTLVSQRVPNVLSVMQEKLVRRVKSVPVVGTERQKQVQRFVKFARVGGRRMSVPQPVQAARLESTVLLLGCHPVKIVRRENIKILVSSKFAKTVLLTLILPHSESHLKQTVKYARMKRLPVW